MHLYRYFFFQNYKVVLTFPHSLFVSSFCDNPGSQYTNILLLTFGAAIR